MHRTFQNPAKNKAISTGKAALSSALLISTLGLSYATKATAQDGPDWLDDGRSKALPAGVVSNDNVSISEDSTPFQLTVEAERALKSNKPDRAIAIIKKSLELDNEDLEAHLIYANALERKLGNQSTEDPELFNRCVREWLIVLRNQFGEEKGENFHGIGIPGLSGKWYSDERQDRARTHLIKLTGSAPKVWETNEKWLQKVCRSGETSVRAKLLNNENKKKDKLEAANPDDKLD
jgi:hypothetical protein